MNEMRAVSTNESLRTKEELHLRQLVEAAVSRYGDDHVDINLNWKNEAESEDLIFDIIYHSRHNSFGIEVDIPITNIQYNWVEELANALNIGFNNDAEVAY